ncbi:IL2RB isoform 6, partial [Pan troglodytes]
TCFYNSRANISCVWSQDGALQDTSCQVHAWPDRRSLQLPWDQAGMREQDKVPMREECHGGSGGGSAPHSGWHRGPSLALLPGAILAAERSEKSPLGQLCGSFLFF